ncbi:MAG: glycoside hydrolase family 44 protein [Polyangiaceae bacterium]
MQNRRRAHLVLAALALVTVSGLVVARSRVPGKVARRVLHQFAPQPEKAAPKAAPVARALPAVPRKFAIKQDIYRGGLRNDWEDWGWSPRQAKGPGPAQIDLSGYGGWILFHPPQKDSYGAVVFRFKAPKEYKDFLEVRTEFEGGGNFTPVVVNSRYRFAQPDGWEQAVIPLYELNPYGLDFDRIQIRAHESVGKQRIQFDQVALSEPLPDAPAPLSFPVHDEAVRIQCELPGHAINPLIFGAAQMKVVADMGASAYRLGGNPMTRFNWKLGNVWNTASDWYFLNVRLDWDWRGFVQMAEQRGAQPVMTVPIIGWVAKDQSSYSFPVSVFGPQQDVESDNPDRGNGNNKAGKPIKPGNPTRTSIEATPEFVAEWVQTMRRESEARGKHQRAYILDNEPNLWNSTHRDVHPAPLTYDELMDRTIRYGAAVRAADPSASIAGPAEWGWSNYFWSAKDLEAGVGSAPDRRAHGDVPLLEWYLKKLREYEQSGKPRILDLLDVHFYPQGKGLYGEAADPDAAARRIRSTRALWDPTYVDESWIKEPVRLLPRLKELVARNYPGLGISNRRMEFRRRKPHQRRHRRRGSLGPLRGGGHPLGLLLVGATRE